MRLTRERKNVFFKGPELYILKSKIKALVIISKTWNSEGNQEHLGEDLGCTLVCMQTRVTLIYVLSICEARNYQNSLPISGQ